MHATNRATKLKKDNHINYTTMKNLVLILTLIIGASTLGMSQGGMIKGKVWDDTENAPMMFANVYVEYADKTIGATTDAEGRFTIKPLPAGTYNLTLSATGYQTKVTQGVLVKKDKITTINDLTMVFKTEVLKQVEIVAYKVKLIDPEDPSAMTMLAAELQATPAAKNPVEAVAMMNSGIKKSETGQLYFRGSRPESMGYYIDGVKQDDNLRGVPGSSIGSMTVYVGGVPAKYGDITGGVVVIETKSYFDLYNQWQATQRK